MLILYHLFNWSTWLKQTSKVNYCASVPCRRTHFITSQTLKFATCTSLETKFVQGSRSVQQPLCLLALREIQLFSHRSPCSKFSKCQPRALALASRIGPCPVITIIHIYIISFGVISWRIRRRKKEACLANILLLHPSLLW